MNHFAIAGLQLAVSDQDNRYLIQAQIEKIKRNFPWVNMVVIGELASFGPGINNAEPPQGKTETLYREIALAQSLWLVPGSLYEKDGDNIYNTTVAISPRGDIVARHRKLFPFLPYEKVVSAGSVFCVFDIPHVGRFGQSICYDQWFPETTRQLAWMGAEVILCPTMTNTIDRELELSLARANAITNQCYFFNINIAGALGNGRSIVVGPDGTVIHEAGTDTEIIPIELDMSQVRKVRERGTLGLGQVLKSFRDSEVEFPVYELRQRHSDALEKLGRLAMPGSCEKGDE